MRLTFALFALLPQRQVRGGDGGAGTHRPRLPHYDSNSTDVVCHKVRVHSEIIQLPTTLKLLHKR